MKKIKSILKYIYRSCMLRFPIYLKIRYRYQSKIYWKLLILLMFPFSVLYFLYKLIQAEYKKKSSEGTAIVFIVKNEGPYLDELICYYKIIGAKRLFFYDNNSTDDTRLILSKYKDYVVYHFLPGETRQQDVYNIFLNEYGYKYKYACFFDADEFIRVENDDITSTLDKAFSKNRKMGSLGLYMLLFGPSGHINKPSGLVIENYLYRFPNGSSFNNLTKHAVLTLYTNSVASPHYPILRKKKAFDLSGTLISPVLEMNKMDNDLIAIYHYYSKSIEEYCIKKNKGDAFNGSNGRLFLEDSGLINANFLDNYMLKYVDRIKAMIVENAFKNKDN